MVGGGDRELLLGLGHVLHCYQAHYFYFNANNRIGTSDKAIATDSNVTLVAQFPNSVLIEGIFIPF